MTKSFTRASCYSPGSKCHRSKTVKHQDHTTLSSTTSDLLKARVKGKNTGKSNGMNWWWWRHDARKWALPRVTPRTFPRGVFSNPVFNHFPLEVFPKPAGLTSWCPKNSFPSKHSILSKGLNFPFPSSICQKSFRPEHSFTGMEYERFSTVGYTIGMLYSMLGICSSQSSKVSRDTFHFPWTRKFSFFSL